MWLQFLDGTSLDGMLIMFSISDRTSIFSTHNAAATDVDETSAARKEEKL
jgi:hypothetical protein